MSTEAKTPSSPTHSPPPPEAAPILDETIANGAGDADLEPEVSDSPEAPPVQRTTAAPVPPAPRRPAPPPRARAGGLPPPPVPQPPTAAAAPNAGVPAAGASNAAVRNTRTPDPTARQASAAPAGRASVVHRAVPPPVPM